MIKFIIRYYHIKFIVFTKHLQAIYKLFTSLETNELRIQFHFLMNFFLGTFVWFHFVGRWVYFVGRNV